jgi:hypothetical protein
MVAFIYGFFRRKRIDFDAVLAAGDIQHREIRLHLHSEPITVCMQEDEAGFHLWYESS